MATVDEAVQKQHRNIETRTGKPIDEWVALVRASGKAKHGEILAWLKSRARVRATATRTSSR